MPEVAGTQQAIMNAGKQEFLEKGYKDANLRSIAARAGVTTGAIYGYFADKHELFRSLVEPVASDCYQMLQDYMGAITEMPDRERMQSMHEYTKQGLSYFFDYIYDHFEVFRLITCCSFGTEYENYIDQLVEVEVKGTRAFVRLLENQGYSSLPISDNLYHILANAYFSAIFEVVAHNMERAEAKAYVDQITMFFTAGWDVLLSYHKVAKP